MDEKKVYLKIFRFDPIKDKAPKYEIYEVPWRENLTLLSALDYIRKNLDETLAFRDYCCGCSWCMSCLMMVNGKGVQACSKILESSERLTIEPLRGFPIIRDLVVDFGIEIKTPFADLRRTEGTFLRKGYKAKRRG